MSLKTIVLALLVINFGYFANSQNWLTLLTGGDATQREPERIAKQINADAITVTPVSALAKLPAQNPLMPVLTTSEAELCKQEREVWLIYMGPYATAALSEKKKAELKKIGIATNNVTKASLPIGLSLGQFETEAAARLELKRLSAKGIKTATILLWERAPTC
jgi:hypothetical protein